MQLNQHLVISTYSNILNKAWYAEQQQGHVNYLKITDEYFAVKTDVTQQRIC